MTIDYVLQYMEKKGVPLTREKYLEYAYLGDPPKQLSAEEEQQLPEQFRKHAGGGSEFTGSEDL